MLCALVFVNEPVKAELVDQAVNPNSVRGWTQLKLAPTQVSEQPTLTLNTFSTNSDIGAGDCLVFEVAPIADYKTKEDYLIANGGAAGDVWAPVPAAGLTTCSFAPEATCARVDHKTFRIQVNSGATLTTEPDGKVHLKGDVGPFQNPFSENQFKFQTITLLQGCVSGRNLDIQDKQPYQVISQLASQTGSVAVTSQEVGASTQATFSIDVGAMLPPWGGKFYVEVPMWYSLPSGGAGTSEAAFNSSTTCSSTQVVLASANPTGRPVGSINNGAFELVYTALQSGVSSTVRNVQVVCQNWRNPLTPSVASGFTMQLQDWEDTRIATTTAFALDASSFTPSPIVAADIFFEPTSDRTVQKLSTYGLAFASPVPLQITDGGCYIKFTFPADFVFETSSFTSFQSNDTITYNRIKINAGTISLYQEAAVTDWANRAFVFHGCTQKAAADYNRAEHGIGLSMGQIKNPYSVRTSAAVKIEIAVDSAFSKKIASTESLSLLASKLAYSPISDLIVAVGTGPASQKVVQEDIKEIKFTFKTTSVIPGTSNGFNQAVHLFLPRTFDKSSQVASASASCTFGDGSNVAIAVDESGIYAENCQVAGYVCFLVQIPSANDVPAGTYTLTITDGLKNPVSVDRIDNAEKLTIRTMLSDSGKGVWSSIDQANLGSSYRAVPGEIDAGTMVPTPPAENAALGVAAAQVVDTTYAPNQLLDFKFVPKHSVPRGGFLKVRYPPGTFEFNSAATAVAQFAVKASGSDKNVANILQVFNNDQKDPLCTVNGVEGGVGCVIGVVSDADGLKAGAEYYIRLAGLRNPRHVIDYDKMDAKNIAYWEVRTYDSGEKPDDTKNLIDVGVGGTRPIKTVAEIATFNVEPLNTTNGANGSYFITWYSEIVAKDGDVLAVPFPAETSFHPPTKGTKRLDCVATVGTLTLACTFRADQKDEKDPDVALVNGKNTGWKYGPEEITQEAGYAKSPSTYNVLEMTLKGVTTRTGLYKVKVDAVTNPRSRRGSSAFGRVTHTTATGAEIQEYRVKPIYKAGSTTEFQLNSADEITYTTPPVSVATEAGSELQYVNTVNITQHSELYGKKTVYEIRYRAYSVVRAVNGNGAKLKLALSYPKQVSLAILNRTATTEDYRGAVPVEQSKIKDFVGQVDQMSYITQGCKVYEGRVARAAAKCFASKDGRLIEIYDAGDTVKGFSGTVTVLLDIMNPKTNWDEVGFKIRTYEMTASGIALVDKLEGDALRPTLQCQAPCQYCEDGGTIAKASVDETEKSFSNGQIQVPKYVRGYCTRCWQDTPTKYLQTWEKYDKAAGKGNSTCLARCDNGWTSNGDTATHVCTRCNVRCQTCDDQGKVGDKDLCRSCSRQYPWSYRTTVKVKDPKDPAKEIDKDVSTCFEQCGSFPENPTAGQKARGLYRITPESCGDCNELCLNCDGDKFNCTKCDVDLKLALFQKKMLIGGQPTLQGTCAKQCPTTYYMDRNAKDEKGKLQWVCKECNSPCAACEAGPDDCKACDGTRNRQLLWQAQCWVECPGGTAADLATQKCVPCGPNCNKCSVSSVQNQQGSCHECDRPFYLEMVDGTGRCVSECTQPGYRPNNAGTHCINKTEFPEIGPIFAILSAIVFVAIMIVKYCFKKETEVIPSLIASISVIEYFAILFQIWMCAIFLQPRYLAFTLVAFGVLVALNIYNMYYIKTNVASRDARKQERLSQKKVKRLIEDYKRKEKRRAAYAKAMERYQRKKQQSGAASTNGYKPLAKPTDGDADQIAEGGSFDEFFVNLVARKRANMRKVYDLDDLSDPGSSISQRELEEMKAGLDEDEIPDLGPSSSDDDEDDSEEEYEGGSSALIIPSAQFLEENGLIKKGTDAKPEYYQEKDIEDKGFNKWVDAYDRTAVAIQWTALIITFKVYRLTYSYFMGRKQFLVLYQKKKFKKHTIVVTLVSQFLVELPLIICDVVALSSLPWGEQLILTVIDTLAISVFLIVLEFVEIARLDKIMKTANTRGHKAKKSAAACEDSDEDDLLSDSDDKDDDYPDWRLMLKNVEGNPDLFATTTTQLKLNELSRLYDPRVARSCIDFNTGTEKEDDPREVRSFPTSPRAYLEFEAPNFGNYGNAFDNCYAESKGPLAKDALKTYSEMGTQAQPSDILTALARKGGDLVTPGLDTDGDYSRRRGTKKKRGRKNKYITQIDAEDDEEADQMSDGSEDDGLDGIKEEDEEDEEERLAKLAKQKADAEAKAKKDGKKKGGEEKGKDASKKKKDEEAKRKAEEEARLKAEKEGADAERLKKEKSSGSHLNGQGASDNQSELSLMMAQSAALKGFGNKGGQVMEVPPTAESRRFNECDIIGNLDRDDKGNVLVGQGQDGKGASGAGGAGPTGGAGGADGAGAGETFFDKEGKPTNERGYLIDPKTGDVINNMNGEKMFAAKDLDEKGEVPAPFNVEKHNFNPHLVRGDFDFDRNGKPVILKDKSGAHVDKRGNRVSSRGYRVDQGGNILDNYNRKKLDKAHTTQDGDLPKLFNYNGRRFDITDVIGQLDKDANGNIQPLTDEKGNLVDNKGRRINSRGYLIDEFGNVIDKDGRQIFEAKHLSDDEIPKIFPFTKFNIKNVLGDFEMDPLGNPILDKDANGKLVDRQGRRVNSKGYLIDSEGNVINKHGRLMFPKSVLDSEEDIPKVFRTGLLKSDTASSLSRLMSEIGKNQPSEFDQEEQRIQEEIAQNIRKQKRGNSGNTSVDSMMEDTPANYNYQNQRFEGEMGEGEGEEGEEEEDEYGSQYDQVMGQTGMTQGAGHELAKKRRKKKKKKKRKRQEMEDPSLREHLLAGAYGGVAKPKPKRAGVKYTTDLNAGLRDLATPGDAPMGNFMRDPSKKMIASLSGFANMAGQAPESSRGRRNKTIRSSHGRSEIGSNIGSRVGGMKRGDTTSKLLDPQQREEQLKQEQMDEIAAKKAAKLAARKRKLGKPGKISKDADFEKMFGKDIDEFLEDSEWDIESIDKMSQFSKNSKQTIRSAAQAGKLRGLEKLYLQRIETSMNKNTLQMTGQPGAAQKGKKKKDGFRGDSSEQEGSLASPAKLPQKAKQAWDTGSRMSRGSQSVHKQFKGTK